jgi:hypothetical protein
MCSPCGTIRSLTATVAHLKKLSIWSCATIALGEPINHFIFIIIIIIIIIIIMSCAVLGAVPVLYPLR